MSVHSETSPVSNRKMTLNVNTTDSRVKDLGGTEIFIEDWWDRVSGKSWMYESGNRDCYQYALRVGYNRLPIDDEVLYGKVNETGCLVHISEIIISNDTD